MTNCHVVNSQNWPTTQVALRILGGRFPFLNYPCEVKFIQHQALTHFGWQSGMACPDKNTPTSSNGSSGLYYGYSGYSKSGHLLTVKKLPLSLDLSSPKRSVWKPTGCDLVTKYRWTNFNCQPKRAHEHSELLRFPVASQLLLSSPDCIYIYTYS